MPFALAVLATALIIGTVDKDRDKGSWVEKRPIPRHVVHLEHHVVHLLKKL